LEPFSFQILTENGSARTAVIHTAHGRIKTPAFVPVATLGAIKSLSSAHFSEVGIQVMITNAYHLHLQPGEGVIRQMGGLHRFLGWSGPLMMDSGGFQVFSLGAARESGGSKIFRPLPDREKTGKENPSQGKRPRVRITEEGVAFISYRDGSTHHFTPEQVVTTGRHFGIDGLMVLDECTSPFHSHEETREAMERTHRWALRSLEEFHRLPGQNPSLFGIVQGGAFQDLRETSAAFVAAQPFHGYAIGGFLGTSSEELTHILQWTIPFLPSHKPRHFLGIGLVEDIFEMVRHGVDLFDCTAPTLLAANGTLLTRDNPRFRLRILNHRHKTDDRPIEEHCDCYTCRHHSRAYLRHLFLAKEPTGPILATLHNLHFMESLMGEIRQAITERGFEALRKSWMKKKEPQAFPERAGAGEGGSRSRFGSEEYPGSPNQVDFS
jgi:queuine tRNA-ribosyltransferase